MIGLTNFEIERYMHKHALNFRGVYSSNNIDRSLISRRNNFSIICNMSKRSERGSHFVCIVVQPACVTYIDSFGLPCTSLHIRKFLREVNRPILFNCRTIQSLTSSYCGFYCILFALFYDDRMLHKIKLTFSSDYEANDRKCIKYIRALVDINT